MLKKNPDLYIEVWAEKAENSLNVCRNSIPVFYESVIKKQIAKTAKVKWIETVAIWKIYTKSL